MTSTIVCPTIKNHAPAHNSPGLTEGASHVVSGQPEGGDLVNLLLLLGEVGGTDHATEGVDPLVDPVPPVFLGLISSLLARAATRGDMREADEGRDRMEGRRRSGYGSVGHGGALHV